MVEHILLSLVVALTFVLIWAFIVCICVLYVGIVYNSPESDDIIDRWLAAIGL